MERHVVIGTAGHIDHGKTTLVKALTGVDTDRLAEEKARGITIDLGFAPLELPGLRASIVDVPGHEGFIRNMVAGATGIDLALLVVAADEGVMPQTREHAAILRHLGVTRGVVAITKDDLAEAEWRSLVAEDIAALIRDELGATWPAVAVSAADGRGLDELRALLAAEAAKVPPRPARDRFRLPVDRVFPLAGAGTVVTGTAWSGSVSEGDTVRLLPSGRTARVRSIQVHGAAAHAAEGGRRAALALVGVDRADAERGTTVVSGDGWNESRALDVAATLARGVTLKLRSRLRVHHGTAEVMARVSRVGASSGEQVALRLRLDQPLVTRAGDRLVLRSWSPVTTIGGAVVTDPEPADRRQRRRAPALPAASDAELLQRLVSGRGARGLGRPALEVSAGLDAARFEAALSEARTGGVVEHEGWLVAEAEIAEAATKLGAAVDAYHAGHPLEEGMSLSAWRASVPGDERLATLASARLEAAGQVERAGGVVRRPGWNPAASAGARETQERVLGILRDAGAEPPSAAELAASLPEVDVQGVLRLLARESRIIAVADRFYEKSALDLERERLEAALRELGPATPASIRERMGRSRKWLIPLLEWADRQGLTVRTGDRRALRNTGGA